MALIRLSIAVLFISNQVTFGALPDGSGSHEQRRPDELWLTDGTKINIGDAKLEAVLNRVGPNMKASMDYHDYRDIELPESVLAWKLMRQQAGKFARQQVDRYGSSLDRLLMDAKVSKSCQESVRILLSSARNLDFWSTQSK